MAAMAATASRCCGCSKSMMVNGTGKPSLSPEFISCSQWLNASRCVYSTGDVLCRTTVLYCVGQLLANVSTINNLTDAWAPHSCANFEIIIKQYNTSHILSSSSASRSLCTGFGIEAASGHLAPWDLQAGLTGSWNFFFLLRASASRLLSAWHQPFPRVLCDVGNVQ